MVHFLKAQWQAPPSVQAMTVVRIGGGSADPYGSMNCAVHVGDQPLHVEYNRGQLINVLKQQNPLLEFQWLDQVHGNRVLVNPGCGQLEVGDAIYLNQPNKVAVVQTADCVPIFLCAQNGEEVALVHAGWRGLAGGILAKTIDNFYSPTFAIQAFIGAAICREHYWVGDEVRDQFISQNTVLHKAFALKEKAAVGAEAHRASLWYFDLYRASAFYLKALGIHQITSSGYCTHEHHRLFYSVRRKSITGRNAHLIWLQS
jgi:polyphenol oxidase